MCYICMEGKIKRKFVLLTVFIIELREDYC